MASCKGLSLFCRVRLAHQCTRESSGEPSMWQNNGPQRSSRKQTYLELIWEPLRWLVNYGLSKNEIIRPFWWHAITVKFVIKFCLKVAFRSIDCGGLMVFPAFREPRLSVFCLWTQQGSWKVDSPTTDLIIKLLLHLMWTILIIVVYRKITLIHYPIVRKSSFSGMYQKTMPFQIHIKGHDLRGGGSQKYWVEYIWILNFTRIDERVYSTPKQI